jgi:hypothetical protein
MAGGPYTDTYKLTYQRLVELAVQQRKSRFEAGFTFHADLRGRQAQVLDLVEPTTAIVNGVRGGDSPNIEQNHQPVWIQPLQIEWGKLIEKEDWIKALTDYESAYVQSGAAAIVRGRDAVFAASLLGNRIVGLDGATSQAYTSPDTTVSNVVGSSDGATPAGMNVRKLQRAKRLLRQRYVEVDYEELWCAMNGQQMEELFNDILTINTDEAKMAYIDKDTRMVQRVAGVNIVSFESIPLITGDAVDYTAVLWCKSGMHYADFDPLSTYAEPNPAKKFRVQCYTENWFGATRSEDAKVVQIATAQAPAGPNG